MGTAHRKTLLGAALAADTATPQPHPRRHQNTRSVTAARPHPFAANPPSEGVGATPTPPPERPPTMQTLAAVRCDPLDWDTDHTTNVQWCRMHRQLFDHHDGCPGDVTADTYPDDRDADLPHPGMT